MRLIERWAADPNPASVVKDRNTSERRKALISAYYRLFGKRPEDRFTDDEIEQMIKDLDNRQA